MANMTAEQKQDALIDAMEKQLIICELSGKGIKARLLRGSLNGKKIEKRVREASHNAR